jgi:hypothetical protein
VKFATDRPFADPDQAARKLLELANAAEADRDQRIAIEPINLPFLRAGGSADKYRGAVRLMEVKGWSPPFDDPIPLSADASSSHCGTPAVTSPACRRPSSCSI